MEIIFSIILVIVAINLLSIFLVVAVVKATFQKMKSMIFETKNNIFRIEKGLHF